jgi:hypothetical protein
MRTKPSLCIRLIIGSELTSASISPRRAAATAVEVTPMPMKDASSALKPLRTSIYAAMKCVLDPGEVTPIFRPLRLCGPAYAMALEARVPSTKPG